MSARGRSAGGPAQTRTLRHDRGADSTPRQPVLLGRGARRDLVVPVRGALVLGRVAPASVVLDDEGVSRRHAEVQGDRDPPVLRDLGSKNGTRVDGELVVEHALRSGDVIELGDARLEFRLVSPAQL
nr:FHA domain-containing protein [Deltaproteobacteria bacterium]